MKVYILDISVRTTPPFIRWFLEGFDSSIYGSLISESQTFALSMEFSVDNKPLLSEWLLFAKFYFWGEFLAFLFLKINPVARGYQFIFLFEWGW